MKKFTITSAVFVCLFCASSAHANIVVDKVKSFFGKTGLTKTKQIEEQKPKEVEVAKPVVAKKPYRKRLAKKAPILSEEDLVKQMMVIQSHDGDAQVRTEVVDDSNYKTEGNYVGFDLVGTRITFNEYYKTIGTDSKYINGSPHYKNSGLGVGLNYKYAFNFNGIFLAPGIFIEQNNAQAKGSEGSSKQRNQVLNRGGLKLDFGYDVSKTFSPYLTGGYSWINYKTRSSCTSCVTSGYQSSAIFSGVTGAWFYGAGMKINYNKNISFTLEYNRSSYRVIDDVDLNPLVRSVQYNSFFKTKLDIIKAGISYKF